MLLSFKRNAPTPAWLTTYIASYPRSGPSKAFVNQTSNSKCSSSKPNPQAHPPPPNIPKHRAKAVTKPCPGESAPGTGHGTAASHAGRTWWRVRRKFPAIFAERTSCCRERTSCYRERTSCYRERMLILGLCYSKAGCGGNGGCGGSCGGSCGGGR